MEKVFSYLRNEGLCPPASQEQIKMIEKKLGVALPTQYIDFLLHSNGYEGIVGKSYLVLWKIENLVMLNEEYAVNEFAPYLVLIGSDGGGEAYAFDTRMNGFPIINTPFIGLGLEEETIIGNSFSEFFENLFN